MKITKKQEAEISKKIEFIENVHSVELVFAMSEEYGYSIFFPAPIEGGYLDDEISFSKPKEIIDFLDSIMNFLLLSRVQKVMKQEKEKKINSKLTFVDVPQKIRQKAIEEIMKG